VKGEAVPKYVIERNMPGAGAMSRDELAAIAEKSCRALEEIGSHIQWVESFVTADKVYSVGPKNTMWRKNRGSTEASAGGL
jgi:hypothetical protein